MYGGNGNDTLISFEEFCERLMVSESVGYRLLREKKVKAFKIGSIWKIPEKAISKFIQESCE